MYRFIKGLLAVVLTVVVAASCEREDVHQTEQTGYLYIDLQQDFTVDPVFKSEAAEDMIFSITIYDWNGDYKGVLEFNLGPEEPESISILGGEIYAVVCNNREPAIYHFEPKIK